MTTTELQELSDYVQANEGKIDKLTALEFVEWLLASVPSLGAFNYPPPDSPLKPQVNRSKDDNFRRVASVQDVSDCVNEARQTKKILRVIGAGHSVSSAILSDRSTDLSLQLTGDLRAVQFLERLPDHAIVKVGGGCYLGHNPMDEESTPANSLNQQLDVEGYALPILGGMSHQSCAGFVITGSAGGSTRHGFADAVESIDLVDGSGKLMTLRKGQDLFNAVGVSMGLLGVVTSVVLKVRPAYLVAGTETTLDVKDSVISPSSSKNRFEKLREALESEEYFHLNWYPQKYVQRVTEYRATAVPNSGDLNPYVHILSKPILNVLAAAVLHVANQALAVAPRADSVHRLVGFLLSKFVTIGKTSFRDHWYSGLPVDDQALIDTWMKTDFTEIWMPLENTDAAMEILVEMYGDQVVAGNFACEIYAAKQSPFWLSAAHNGPVLRIDPYWWSHNSRGTPREYFGHFWNRLLELPHARPHWGKFLPLPRQSCGRIVFDRAHLSRLYPRLEDWISIRAKLDPDQVFVTPYWRDMFEIASVAK